MFSPRSDQSPSVVMFEHLICLSQDGGLNGPCDPTRPLKSGPATLGPGPAFPSRPHSHTWPHPSPTRPHPYRARAHPYQAMPRPYVAMSHPYQARPRPLEQPAWPRLSVSPSPLTATLINGQFILCDLSQHTE